MSSGAGPDETAASLALERKRVLEAVAEAGGQALTGPAILRRMRERPTEARPGTGNDARPDDERLLYPALHSLEAEWKLQARWLPDASGAAHRTYRRHRLLPHGIVRAQPR